MKLNLVNVVVFGIGAILVYAAVKDVDPRDLVKQGLGGPAPAKTTAANSALATAPATPAPPIPTYLPNPNNGQPQPPVLSV